MSVIPRPNSPSLDPEVIARWREAAKTRRTRKDACEQKDNSIVSKHQYGTSGHVLGQFKDPVERTLIEVARDFDLCTTPNTGFVYQLNFPNGKSYVDQSRGSSAAESKCAEVLRHVPSPPASANEGPSRERSVSMSVDSDSDKIGGSIPCGTYHADLALETVYKITSPSGKGCVGQTIQKLDRRMSGHKGIPAHHLQLLRVLGDGRHDWVTASKRENRFVRRGVSTRSAKGFDCRPSRTRQPQGRTGAGPPRGPPLCETGKYDVSSASLAEDGVEGSIQDAHSQTSCPPCTAKDRCRHKRIPSIYCLTFPSRKQYVGQTVWPVVRMNRYKANKCNAVSQQPALHNALAKYGWDNVTVEWIAGGPENAPIPEEWLDELEEMFIARFNTVAPNGYNIQKGGRVAWRGVSGLSRTEPRGPRSEEVKQQLRDTWSRKRDARLADADPEVAHRARLHAATQQASRQAKQEGVHIDGRYGPNQHRCDTWERKREAKLALLPPEEAAKKRAKMERARERVKANYYANK